MRSSATYLALEEPHAQARLEASMNVPPFKVLFLGANADEMHRLEDESGRDASFAWVHVVGLAAGLQRLAGHDVDAVVLDLNLPDGLGLDAFRQVHAQAPQVPVLLLTDRHDDPQAGQA